MATRRERLEAKAARREEWADKRAGKLEHEREVFDRAMGVTGNAGDNIMATQPSHGGRPLAKQKERSRNRHNDRTTEHTQMEKHHRDRARGIDAQLNRSVYSDDEDIEDRLQERIDKKRKQLDGYKDANKLIRKVLKYKPNTRYRPSAEFKPEPVTEEEMIAIGIPAKNAAIMAKSASAGGLVPFELASYSASLRKDTKRLEQVRAAKAPPPTPTAQPESKGTWTIVPGGQKLYPGSPGVEDGGGAERLDFGKARPLTPVRAEEPVAERKPPRRKATKQQLGQIAMLAKAVGVGDTAEEGISHVNRDQNGERIKPRLDYFYKEDAAHIVEQLQLEGAKGDSTDPYAYFNKAARDADRAARRTPAQQADHRDSQEFMKTIKPERLGYRPEAAPTEEERLTSEIERNKSVLREVRTESRMTGRDLSERENEVQSEIQAAENQLRENAMIFKKKDTDGDGQPDVIDRDDDNDGIPDTRDSDANGNGVPDKKELKQRREYERLKSHHGRYKTAGTMPTYENWVKEQDQEEANRRASAEQDARAAEGKRRAEEEERQSNLAALSRLSNLSAKEREHALARGEVSRAAYDESMRVTPPPKDSDGDGQPDVIDRDDDNDGIPDTIDRDDDGDGVPDELDRDNAMTIARRDSDGDGLPDTIDRDDDNDRVPDTIDKDDDGDGIPDVIDTNGGQMSLIDTDGDGVPNVADSDDDNDGVPDVIDKDDDGDGIPDRVDSEGPEDMAGLSMGAETIIQNADRSVSDVDGDGDMEVTTMVKMDDDEDVFAMLQDDDMDGDVDSVTTIEPVTADIDNDGDLDSGAVIQVDADADGDIDQTIIIEDDDMDGNPDTIQTTEPIQGDLDMDGDPDAGALVRIDQDGDGDSDITNVIIDDDMDGDPDAVIPVEDDNEQILDGVDYVVKDDDDEGGIALIDHSPEPDVLDISGGTENLPMPMGGVDVVEGEYRDLDDDGLPDVIDPDDDNDGIPDRLDNDDPDRAEYGEEVSPSPFGTHGPMERLMGRKQDTDGDGLPDVIDPDDDNDGIPDSIDVEPGLPALSYEHDDEQGIIELSTPPMEGDRGDDDANSGIGMIDYSPEPDVFDVSGGTVELPSAGGGLVAPIEPIDDDDPELPIVGDPSPDHGDMPLDTIELSTPADPNTPDIGELLGGGFAKGDGDQEISIYKPPGASKPEIPGVFLGGPEGDYDSTEEDDGIRQPIIGEPINPKAEWDEPDPDDPGVSIIPRGVDTGKPELVKLPECPRCGSTMHKGSCMACGQEEGSPVVSRSEPMPVAQGNLGEDFATNKNLGMTFDSDVSRPAEKVSLVDVEAYKNRPLPGQIDMLEKQEQPEGMVVVVQEQKQPEPVIIVVEETRQPEPVVVVQEQQQAEPEPVIVVVREELNLNVPPEPRDTREKKAKTKQQIIQEATQKALRQSAPKSTKQNKPKKSKSRKQSKRRAHPFLSKGEARRSMSRK